MPTPTFPTEDNTAKHVILVRHGRTAWNAVGKFQGIVDIPLDEVGREQVATAKALLERDLPAISYAVVSDLGRARQTMSILLEGRALEAVVDEGWRERDFGSWEGLTWAEITRENPELAAAVALDVRNFQPKNGEDFSLVKQRVHAAFERALQRISTGQRALVVAHAGVLHALLDVVFGADREAMMIPPAGIIRLRVQGDSAQIL